MRARATIGEFVVRRRAELLTLAAGLLIAAATRFPSDQMPLAGLDRSWEAAIAMVLRSSSNFGGDVVFTYGPLGFIQNPTFHYFGSGALATWLNFAERFALAIMLLWIVRGRLGWPLALIFTYAILTILWVCSPVVVIVATVAVVCRPSKRRCMALALGGGGLAAYCLLEKANSGVLAAVVLVLGLLFLDARWRLLGLAFASWVTALVGLWLLTGQTLTDVPGYLGSAIELTSAYAAALMSGPTADRWQYGAAFVLLAIGAGAIWATGKHEERDVRVPLVAIWVVTWFLLFKQGFVRQGSDHVHTLFMFAAATAFIAVLPWSIGQRWAATTAVIAGVAMYLAATPLKLTDVVDPLGRMHSTARAFKLTVNKGEVTRRQAQARKDILTGLSVPPQYARQLRSVPSTVWPYELSVAWAADAKLRPLPSLQAYAGYSERLDRRNADLLASSDRAPQRILLHDAPEPDGRILSFDAPAASREMVCRYRPEGPAQGSWLMLERGADRCRRAARRLSTTTAPWGRTVAVPAPSNVRSFVFVRIAGAEISGLEQIRNVAFKPFERQLLLDASRGRLAPGTAAGGSIIRSAAAADWPAPFALAPNSAAVGVDRDGDPSGSESQLRYTFYEQQVDP